MSHPSNIRSPGDLADLVADHLRLLDRLFADQDLIKLRNRRPLHPVIPTYDLLRAFLQQMPHVEYATREATIRALTTVMVGWGTWAPPGSGDRPIEDLIPDEVARRVAMSRVSDPNFYDDVILELYYTGWLKSSGWDAILGETEGLPDIQVSAPEDFWAEVKNVRSTSKTDRVRDVISKANRQFRRASTSTPGLLYIMIQRRGGRATFGGDVIPNDVSRFVEEARSALSSGMFRSVSGAVLMWDDLRIATQVPALNLIYGARRRAVSVPNLHAYVPLPRTATETLPGSTIVVAIRQDPPTTTFSSATFGNVITQDGLQTFNEFYTGLLPNHLLEIFYEPTQTAEMQLGEVTISLRTRNVVLNGIPSSVVISCALVHAEAYILSAMHLFGSESERNAWAFDPRAAFDAGMARYGGPAKVGNAIVKFAEELAIDGPPEPPNVQLAPNRQLISYIVGDSSSSVVRLIWAHVIDRKKYRSVVESQYPVTYDPNSWRDDSNAG